jgi:zinc transport system substrate-binding protein
MLAFVVAGLWGCESRSDGPSSESHATVVASIFPVGDLVERMVDDGVEVQVILPPGASPATFDLTPRQFQEMAGASLYVLIGGGLDEWTAGLPQATGGTAPVLRLSEGLQLLHDEEGAHEESGHDHASGNPHIWLDPILVRDRLLPRLAQALVAAFPQDSAAIRGRTAALADSLLALDQEIRQTLAPIGNRAFIATHAAWTYYAARYGLQEVGVVHASPGREPSGRELAHLVEVAREHSVRCLFIEPQIGEVAARALAAELSLTTRVLDPLGGPEIEGRNGYFALLRFNTAQLAAGLEGERL